MRSAGQDDGLSQWLAKWLSYERAVGVFVVLFVAAGMISQAFSEIPANREAAAIESFTAGLLWMLSLVALFSAFKASPTAGRVVFWLAAGAALGALAIDEAVALHERTESYGINDDLAKIVMWLAVPFVLRYIARASELRIVTVAFVVGYLFHALYLLVEMGDGEFFQLPFANDNLKYMEEVFELLLLAAYFYGFAIQYLRMPRGGDAAR